MLFVESTRPGYVGSKTSPCHGLMVLATIKTSNITDHANSVQHKSAMMYLHKDQAKSRNEPITSYSPIAQSLLSLPIDPAVRERVEKKFDISFVLAKEHIPFLKYPASHELEERYGVDLGVTI